MEKPASINELTPFYALIAAAGTGSRMGGGPPKQYVNIQGKTLLRRTVETFLSCKNLKELRVIINQEHKELYADSVRGLNIPDPVFGADNRNQSVYKGISSFSHLKDEDIILIHDSVRPFVGRDNIQDVLSALKTAPAATLAQPVADTLRREDGAPVDRQGLWAVQTPQGFHYGLIRRAHEQLGAKDWTDDASMVAALGETVELVPGSRRNFKITTPDDMEFARTIAENRAVLTRMGTGFDVHAFDRSRKAGIVRLCGVDIPHDYALSGHSDADVGLHALTDALLGALAAGDIGQHFPPSDAQWQGADSAIFLKKAAGLVKGSIVNLDVTLICEAPKIGPYREAMQKRIAEICGIAPGQVGVKATTTEGLGFTGRGEGIAAQAAASITM